MATIGAQNSSQSTLNIPAFGIFENPETDSLFQQFVLIHSHGLPHEKSKKLNHFIKLRGGQFAQKLTTVANDIDAYFHHNYHHLDDVESEAAYEIKIKKFYVWKSLIEFLDHCVNGLSRNSKLFELYSKLGPHLVRFATDECLVTSKIIRYYREQKNSVSSYYFYLAIMDMSSIIISASGNVEAKLNDILEKHEPHYIQRAIAIAQMYIDCAEFVCEFELNDAASALLTVGVNLCNNLKEYSKANSTDQKEIEGLTAYYRAAVKRVENRNVPPFLDVFKDLQNVYYKQWVSRHLPAGKLTHHKRVEQKIAAFDKVLNAKKIDHRACYRTLQDILVCFGELETISQQKVAEKLKNVLSKCHSGLVACLNIKKAHRVDIMICEVVQLFINDIENDLANYDLKKIPDTACSSTSSAEPLPVVSSNPQAQVATPEVAAPAVTAPAQKSKQEEVSAQAQAIYATAKQVCADEIKALELQMQENHQKALKQLELQQEKRLSDLKEAHSKDLQSIKDKKTKELEDDKQKLIEKNEEAVRAAKKEYRKKKEEYKAQLGSQNTVLENLKKELKTENAHSRAAREQFLLNQKEMLSQLKNTIQMLKADIEAVKVQAQIDIAVVKAQTDTEMAAKQQNLAALNAELFGIQAQARLDLEKSLQERASAEREIANHIQQARDNIAAAKALDNSDAVKRSAITGMQPLNLALYDIPEIEPHIPDVAKYIMEELTEAGVECYIVGGFVRDHLSGVRRLDGDIDMVINGAIPSHLQNRFKPTGDKQCFKRGNVDIRCDTWDNNDPEKGFKKLREKALISVNTFFCTHLGKVYDPFNAITHLKSPYLHFVGDFASLHNNASLILRTINARTKLNKMLHDTHLKEIKPYIGRLKTIPFGVWVKHVGELFLNVHCLENLRYMLDESLLFQIIPLQNTIPQFSSLVHGFWGKTLVGYAQNKAHTTPYHVVALFILLSVAQCSRIDAEQEIDKSLKIFIEQFENCDRHSFIETTRPILVDLLKKFNLYKLNNAAIQGSYFTPGYEQHCQVASQGQLPLSSTSAVQIGLTALKSN